MMTNTHVGMPTSSIMTGLLTQRKAREFSKNSSQLFLRPTEDGKFYRLRLLNTQPNDNFVKSSNFAHYRDFPFLRMIQRSQSAVHTRLSALRLTM